MRNRTQSRDSVQIQFKARGLERNECVEARVHEFTGGGGKKRVRRGLRAAEGDKGR